MALGVSFPAAANPSQEKAQRQTESRYLPQTQRQKEQAEMSEIRVTTVEDTTVFELYDSRIGDIWIARACILDNTGYILSVDVRLPFRGRGYGKALMQALVEYVDANGVGDIWLDVNEMNIPAIRLYEGVGFETYRTHVGFREMVRSRK